MLSVTEHRSPKEFTTVLLWAEVVVVCQVSFATMRPNQLLVIVTVILLALVNNYQKRFNILYWTHICQALYCCTLFLTKSFFFHRQTGTERLTTESTPSSELSINRRKSWAADCLLQMGFPADVVIDLVSQFPLELNVNTLCSLVLQMTEGDDNSSPSEVREPQLHPGTSQGRASTTQTPSSGKKSLRREEMTPLAPSALPGVGVGVGRLTNDKVTCKVCAEAEVRVTFVPCGHLITCWQCSQKVSRCPICSAFIADRVVTYLSWPLILQ